MEMRKKQAGDLETEAEMNTDEEFEMVRRGGISALNTKTNRTRGQPQKAGKSKQPEDSYIQPKAERNPVRAKTLAGENSSGT